MLAKILLGNTLCLLGKKLLPEAKNIVVDIKYNKWGKYHWTEIECFANSKPLFYSSEKKLDLF